MKILNTSDISPSVAMPIKSGTLKFIQDAHKEALNGLIKNIIDTPIVDTVYILSGCVNSLTAPNYNISEGVLYVNGEVFDFDGTIFATSGLQKAYARIETTQFVANADPVQFTDGVNRNVHNIRKIVIENTITSSGLPEFVNFVTVGRWKESDIVLQNQINTLQKHLPKNRGFINGIDPGETSGSKTVGGDITSAVYYSSEASGGSGFDSTTYLVTISNAMANTNYFVRTSLESSGTITLDNDCLVPVIKKISTTQFYLSLQAKDTGIQNIKIHLEVVSLD
jgi:hypothetical protein